MTEIMVYLTLMLADFHMSGCQRLVSVRHCQKLTLNLRQPKTKSGYRWILVRDTHSSNLAFVVVFTMERAAYQDCFTKCALSLEL